MNSQAVPLRLHGDDVAVTNTFSVLVVSICSALTYRLPAEESKLPCFTLPLKDLADKTFDTCYEVLAWSLNVLMSGHWPETDHTGKKFPPKSFRATQAGKPLAGYWKGMTIEILGDWKWIKETFKFPQYYGANSVCQLCEAVK